MSNQAPTSPSAASRCRARRPRGFGVMHVDDNDRITVVPGEAEGSAAHAGQAGRRAVPAWASTCSRPTFLIDQLQRDAADPNSSHDFGKDIIPYLVKNGKAVAHHFSQSCVTLERGGQALLARRRDRRRLLGRQYRPDRRRPAISTSTTAAGRSGPMARSRRRRNSCMTWTAAAAWRSLAGLGRLHRLGRVAQPFARLHRRARAFLHHASTKPSCCPMSTSAATCGSSKSSSTAACAFPTAWSSARTPSSTPSGSAAPKAASCLITQPMIDKLAQ